MKIASIVKQLKAERDTLDRAIRALAGLGGKPKSGRKPMSKKARAKIAAAQRKRWRVQKAALKS